MERHELEAKITAVVSRIGKSNPQVGNYVNHYLFEDNMVTITVTTGRLNIPVSLIHENISEQDIAEKIMPSFLSIDHPEIN